MDAEWERFAESMDIAGNGWHRAKPFPNGTYAAIRPLMFHWTMIFGVIGDEFGYEDRWCFATKELAEKALDEWDGTGDPQGWHRHPRTARRRPDGDPAREYIAD